MGVSVGHGGLTEVRDRSPSKLVGERAIQRNLFQHRRPTIQRVRPQFPRPVSPHTPITPLDTFHLFKSILFARPDRWQDVSKPSGAPPVFGQEVPWVTFGIAGQGPVSHLM